MLPVRNHASVRNKSFRPCYRLLNRHFLLAFPSSASYSVFTSRTRSSAPSVTRSRHSVCHKTGPRRGLVPGRRPRPTCSPLCWACRRLRLVATVTSGQSIRLPNVAFYDEALHAGPTEPAALTLRYPLLVRDAVDEPLRCRGLRFGLLASSLAFDSLPLDGPETPAVDGLTAHDRSRRRRCRLLNFLPSSRTKRTPSALLRLLNHAGVGLLSVVRHEASPKFQVSVFDGHRPPPFLRLAITHSGRGQSQLGLPPLSLAEVFLAHARDSQRRKQTASASELEGRSQG